MVTYAAIHDVCSVLICYTHLHVFTITCICSLKAYIAFIGRIPNQQGFKGVDNLSKKPLIYTIHNFRFLYVMNFLGCNLCVHANLVMLVSNFYTIRI